MEQGKELVLNNLISLRGKYTQEAIQKEISELMMFLNSKGIKKIGPMVNTTFGIEMQNGQQLMDTEFMIPVDVSNIDSSKYNLKNEFKLTNAVYSKHKGNPIGLQSLYEKLNNFVANEGLQFITSGYNVFVNESNNPDEFEIDIYIGVNPNKL